MSLFDSNITKYIIKGTGFPHSLLRRDRIEIFDGNKNLIGKMDMSFTWIMDVFESSFDRKVLLGFLISIFCSDYDPGL